MDEPQARSEIKQLLAEADHAPNKQHGQNFLADPNITRRIVDLADVEGKNVLEIGAGTGTLTLGLAHVARQVVSFEIDSGLATILDSVLAPADNIDLRIADAAGIDLGAELDGTVAWTMVSNLPYNVGTGIVLDALAGAPQIERFVVMVQREVGERMLAEPGSRVYGIPSVVVGLYATGHIAMDVPPQVFEPQPRVDSVLVVLDRVKSDPLADRAAQIAAVAFNQRRKMLRKSLSGAFDDSRELLGRAGVSETARPEDLRPEDFLRIAEAERT